MVVQLWYQNSSTFTCWELTISSGFAGNRILQANSLTLQMNGSFCKRPLKIISCLKKICSESNTLYNLENDFGSWSINNEKCNCKSKCLYLVNDVFLHVMEFGAVAQLLWQRGVEIGPPNCPALCHTPIHSYQLRLWTIDLSKQIHNLQGAPATWKFITIHVARYLIYLSNLRDAEAFGLMFPGI